MKYFLIIAFISCSINIHAQKIEHLKKGNTYYNQKNYISAMYEYENLLYSNSGKKILGVDAKMNLANCYRIMDEPFKANSLYEEIIAYAEDRISVYLEYGKVLMSMGNYSEAVSYFETYLTKNSTDQEAGSLIEMCRRIGSIKPYFGDIRLISQNEVNDSSSKQLGVTYYGDAVVFSSDEITEETGELRVRNYLNMRASGFDANGFLKKSEKFSHSLNDLHRHDGPATFSRDGIKIYYSVSVKNKAGRNFLQIWSSFFRDGKWTEATVMPFVAMDANYTHPSLSPDGRTLYFASDMKGSMGGYDIWVTHFEGGQWSNPYNLGKQINTEKDEAWPFIHPSGDLFFSSKGHSGLGSYDIFKTKALGNGIDWAPVQNLGKPINSSFSDISFILSDNQTSGFVASNRARTYDIYKYIIADASPLALPDDVMPRKSTGLSEIGHDSKLDQDFPEQTEAMSDMEYVEYLTRLNKNKAKNIPALEENDVPENDPNIEQNPSENPESAETSSDSNLDADVEDIIESIVNDDPTNDDGNENKFVQNNSSNEIKLMVVLKVEDISTAKILTNAVVEISNDLSAESWTVDVNDLGEAIINLEADQKYTLRGKCAGYKESTLPVSTIGVTKSDRASAKLPLEKI